MALVIKFITRIRRMSAIKFHFARLSGVASPLLMTCGKLPRRGFLQVMGNEASSFLQGLITNDMRHFDEHESASLTSTDFKRQVGRPAKPLVSVIGVKSSMYALILNVRGQILYDLILYNLKSPMDSTSTNFLIECDSACLPDLLSLLKKYRLRKKIELNDVSDQFSVWVFNDFNERERKPDEPLPIPELIDPSKATAFTKDPRTQSLGYRMVLPQGIDPTAVIQDPNINPDILDAYVNLRHRLGIWEGIDDIPPAECYPLECNADYMHGVSFHKGCYVGQELTARAYHTGVIRKRVMPIVFDFEDKAPINKWSLIENELGRSVGRFISKLGKYGLAQIRMQECFASSHTAIKGYNGRVSALKPSWWPVEAPKESLFKEQ